MTKPCEQTPLKSTPTCDSTLPVEKRLDDLLSRIPASSIPGLLTNNAKGVRELNLPPYRWWSEALHGVKIGCLKQGGVSKCPTSFPAGISVGSSFNRSLFKAIGSAIGTEARVMSNVGIASLTFWTPNASTSSVRFMCAPEHSQCALTLTRATH